MVPFQELYARLDEIEQHIYMLLNDYNARLEILMRTLIGDF